MWEHRVKEDKKQSTRGEMRRILGNECEKEWWWKILEWKKIVYASSGMGEWWVKQECQSWEGERSGREKKKKSWMSNTSSSAGPTTLHTWNSWRPVCCAINIVLLLPRSISSLQPRKKKTTNAIDNIITIFLRAVNAQEMPQGVELDTTIFCNEMSRVSYRGHISFVATLASHHKNRMRDNRVDNFLLAPD